MKAKKRTQPKKTLKAEKLGPRFLRAFLFAAEKHAGQTRNASTIPYIAHLKGVTSLVLEAGGDEDLAIAALLHDVVEECGGAPMLKEVHRRFGGRVAKVVDGCTDADTFPKPPWRERKETYIKQVETASVPVLLIMVADKLQNGRALLRRLKLQGAMGWGSPSREEKVWYFQCLVEAMQRRLTQLERETNHPTLVSIRLLVGEYAEVVATLTHY